MTKNTHKYNRFNGYSLEDCACELCLHYAGRDTPCPLEVCCCEDEKKQAVARAQEKPELPPLRHRRDPFQPGKVVCADRPECAGCNYPGHGFICGGADGCLKTDVAGYGGLSPCRV